MNPNRIDNLLYNAAAQIEAGHKVALCVLVAARGSTPAPAGAVMVVDDCANMTGTIGGGCVEAEVRSRVIQMLNEKRSGLLKFSLDHDYGWDDGLICGGQIDVAVCFQNDAPNLYKIAQAHQNRQKTELVLNNITDNSPDEKPLRNLRYVLNIMPQPRLYIAGAGHIGRALTPLAADLDFEVTVFDDRADLLQKFIPQPAEKVTGTVHEQIVKQGIDDQTYIVIVTRGHRHDQQVLEAVAECNAKYIGMIGSKRKVKLTFDNLLENGIKKAMLDKVYAPIGVDINSVTVNEIALSIAAQLTAVRRGKKKLSPVTGPYEM